jgi:uncharacterized protein (TIGR02391 family)
VADKVRFDGPGGANRNTSHCLFQVAGFYPLEVSSVSIPRPLNKAILKKMFLKALHEHKRPGGKYAHNSWGYDSMLTTTFLYQFGLTQLSSEEYTTARRAIFELEVSGHIMQDPTQSSDVFKILTDRGLAVVEQELSTMELPSLDINELLSRDDLRNKVRDDYLAGDYESAVFKAFKLVEETVRAKAGQPPSLVGVNLMTTAFKTAGGILQHPETQVDAEREALHQLFRGAIGWFKNPSSHRTVGYKDAQQAAHILAFANLLLELADQCTK